MLFWIMFIIFAIFCVVSHYNNRDTATYIVPNCVIVYAITPTIVAIALIVSAITQYAPDIIKVVLCLWWWK